MPVFPSAATSGSPHNPSTLWAARLFKAAVRVRISSPPMPAPWRPLVLSPLYWRWCQPRSQQRLPAKIRSEEHTSELQSRGHLVCRLLLEEKEHEEMARTDDDRDRLRG